MRHVESVPSSAYTFVGSQNITIGERIPPAAAETLLRNSSLTNITDAWDTALSHVTDQPILDKLSEASADIVYTSLLGSHGNAAVSFYVGPPR